MSAYADTGFIVTLYKEEGTSARAAALFAKATELADRHSTRLGTRSLDLMHVAAALLLETDTFFSFDERQRKEAKADGRKVRPRESLRR